MPIDPAIWPLDPTVTMLNHGSFGSCPRPILEFQAGLRDQMERKPVRFLVDDLPRLLDESRRCLANLVGAAPEHLVFVTNATAGVNAVLRSLRFAPGDELLITDHGYNACSNVVRYVAAREGAHVVTAAIPVPVESPDQIIHAMMAQVTGRTRLALLDHVTSPTAIVFPIAELAGLLAECGVDLLVDGAHAPGMLPLNLDELGAAYYTGNCHKWLCAPKGAGFLYVRPDRQQDLQPPVISHGYNQPRPGHTRLQDAFDWQGTADPTPWLCVGEAIRFLEAQNPGGICGLMRQNRELALSARRHLLQRLPLRPTCAESLLGSMAAFSLPETSAAVPIDPAAPAPLPRLGPDLMRDFAVEVPVYYWPSPPSAMLRISAQAYNTPADYDYLARALARLLQRA